MESPHFEVAQDRARRAAFAVIDRVIALRHRTDGSFEGLRTCHARAREVRQTVATTTTIAAEVTAPFVALLLLVQGSKHIADDDWRRLQDTVTAAFGRALAAAAIRGRLG